jgi:SAM-dependent methyltransferase
MNVQGVYQAISPHFRRRRMRWMLDSLRLKPEETILDVGGLPAFWEETKLPNPIVLLNRSFPARTQARHPRFTFAYGDGCQLPYADGEFAVVVSNSVIEHLGTWENQAQFAAEVRRVGRRLWVQTPAREFFIEPHHLAPFIHWLPVAWQRRLLRNFTLRGWLTRPDQGEVDVLLQELRLLRRSEFAALFPACQIRVERFLGLPKSYIALRP